MCRPLITAPSTEGWASVNVSHSAGAAGRVGREHPDLVAGRDDVHGLARAHENVKRPFQRGRDIQSLSAPGSGDVLGRMVASSRTPAAVSDNSAAALIYAYLFLLRGLGSDVGLPPVAGTFPFGPNDTPYVRRFSGR